jgi:4-hydroxy-4-methyl-2-oxoglutarate aldolase
MIDRRKLLAALDDPQFNMMAEKLYVAVISDILDGMGFRGQVLQPGVVPAQPDPSQVLVGRAATVLVGPQYEVVDQPYTNQIAAIDALMPGDVVVSGVGGMTNVAVWGELFSNAAKARGARGFLTDGCHRDTRMVLDLGFPVFSRGPRPVDISGRGTVISIGRPVEVAGVVVHPGDVVFAEVASLRTWPKRRCPARSKRWRRRTERAKICARGDSFQRSGPNIASSSMVSEPTAAGWPQSLLDVLSPGLDVVQTYTYINNVSILEAPIAPEPSGRISR